MRRGFVRTKSSPKFGRKKLRLVPFDKSKMSRNAPTPIRLEFKSLPKQIQERLLEQQRGQSEDVVFEIGGEKQIKF